MFDRKNYQILACEMIFTNRFSTKGSANESKWQNLCNFRLSKAALQTAIFISVDREVLPQLLLKTQLDNEEVAWDPLEASFCAIAELFLKSSVDVKTDKEHFHPNRSPSERRLKAWCYFEDTISKNDVSGSGTDRVLNFFRFLSGSVHFPWKKQRQNQNHKIWLRRKSIR